MIPMKSVISTYGTQRDYDAMGGAAGDGAEWSPDDFEAMGAFMEAFNRELDASGELVESRRESRELVPSACMRQMPSRSWWGLPVLRRKPGRRRGSSLFVRSSPG